MTGSPTGASATSTTQGAREHARSQEGTLVEAQPVVPASDFTSGPAEVASERLLWAERIAGGNYSHRVLARGTVVRLTDVTGDACAAVLLYNADQPHERLNVADTVKVQWQVYTGQDQLLLSDQGRVLASVVEDRSGRHDTIYGTSSRARNELRYGDGAAHGSAPAGRELLKLAGAKHGLAARDIAPCVTFFQGVRIRPDGGPDFVGSAGQGASVTLRIELPVILLLANTAHPLDPRSDYSCGPLDVLAWKDEPTNARDRLWHHTPEGRRAFTNTAEYLKARGAA